MARAHSAPFTAAIFVGWFDWTPAHTAQFDADRIYHRCHVAEMAAFDAAGQLMMRSPISAIRPNGEEWTTRGIFMHLNVMQESFFGPIEIALPLSVLEGRRFYAFRRSIDGKRHLYLMEYDGATPLVAADEAMLPNPIPTLFTYQGNGKYNLGWDERVEIIMTTPAGFEGAVIDSISHDWCKSGTCEGKLTGQDALEVLRDYFAAHPNSPLKEIAKLRGLRDDTDELKGK